MVAKVFFLPLVVGAVVYNAIPEVKTHPESINENILAAPVPSEKLLESMEKILGS